MHGVFWSFWARSDWGRWSPVRDRGKVAQSNPKTAV